MWRAFDNAFLSVSIHAPVKGATSVTVGATQQTGFNSRTRKGCDVFRTKRVIGVVVSIHAPVKGATAGFDKTVGVIAVSIHAPVKGATPQQSVPRPDNMFQFTHP